MSLDPPDWPAFRQQAHGMLDDMLNYLEQIRERPLWRPMPDGVRDAFTDQTLPSAASDVATVRDEFLRVIRPFSTGNPHPGFMGWVHGGGTPAGMLAEMLAGGMNANLGGRDHAPIAVERQIVAWMRRLFGFPCNASCLFVTGTSMANLIGVLVARSAALGTEVRSVGIAGCGRPLTAYASEAVHNSLPRALEIAGIGRDALRLVRADQLHRIDTIALGHVIAEDRRRGFTPFLVVGTAGTVDIGAIDPLADLADICARERIWFHVDGACAALAMLAADLAPRLAGIERADSLAFDFHKWGQVPYDAGFVLVRDGELHRATFASPAAYLRAGTRGLAAGSPWPCDYGPDLSRGFRALKTWFTLKTYGADALGRVISGTCGLARYLESRIRQTPELELLAPAQLNIVCFRFRTAEDTDEVNAAIVADLHESGVVAPSTTRIGANLAIRAAIVNHRTEERDIEALLQKTIEFGRSITNGRSLERGLAV